jgi:arylsulfatase A-like enzyme
VLAAWGFLFVWFQIYHVTSSTSAPSLLSLALFALAIAGTLFGLLGADGRARRAVVPVLTVLVVAGGALGLGATRPTHGTAQSYRDGHDTGQVILITIDTLRRDALSCYGGDNATPNLDALAENGVVFDNALSAAPWTLPALASIVTGLAPAAHTAVVHGSTLPESLITLAEYLQRDGYHTGAIGYNPYLASSRRMNQGFSSYETYPRPPVARSIASAVLSRVMPRFYLSEASTPDIADMSIQWVTENRERDFFFWSHYFDPHGPWEPPLEYRPALDPPPGMGYRFEGVKEARAGMKAAQPFQRDWLRHLYNGEVRYVDAAVGRFLDALKGLGIYDEALIVVTSDHGEEFWEHGNLGHGQSLYNELLGVPLIVKLPRGAGEVRVPEMVPTQALLATILDLCGVPYESPDPNVSSLRPLIEESAEEFEVRPVFSGALAFYEDQEAVTFDRTKYIRALHSLEEQLYDLQTDPGERDNLIADAPNRAQKARGLLDDHDSLASELRSRFDVLQSENLELDAETIRRLKALGYL